MAVIPKRKMGRPTLLNKKVIETLETALILGATIEIASKSAGISEDTFYMWQREAKDLRARIQDEYERVEESKKAAILAAERSEEPVAIYQPDYQLTPRERDLLNFLKTIEEAEALGAMQHLQFLLQAAPHDVNVSMWVLRTRYGYGDKPQEIRHTGAGGGPVEIQDMTPLTTEERMARILQLFATAVRRQEEAANDTNPGGPTAN